MALRVTNTADLSREVWLRFRKRGLGGSDMGAILQVNKYKSPMDVYLDKRGELPEQDLTSEAAYFGNRLESFVAEEFSLRTGRKVRKNNFLLQHDEYPFLLANVDREIVANEEEGRGILECKTASEYLKQSWNEDEVPASYFIQVQHYLNVTGYRYAYIAALIGGNKFFFKRIDRDNELIEEMTKIAKNFWENHVLKGIPPEWDGSEASSNLINQMYPEAKNDLIELPGTTIDLITEWDKAKANEKFWKTEKEKFANQIKGMLGDWEGGMVGEKKVFWKNQSQTRLDSTRLKKELPEIYEQYAKTSSFRKFDVR